MMWKQNLGPILFVICLTLGFGPLIWGDWMLVHDNFNGFLPYRHFASAAFRNGQFPFWNPWINLGYPFASDPQSGAWYPIVWLLSAFSVYTPRLIAIEWLMHLAIGGLGVVRWMNLGWGIRSDVRWVLGITYAMCGFFTGTAQILPFVIAGAWLPWVFGSFHALVKQPEQTSCLPLAMSMSMLILGGYPSFALTVVWILIAWSLTSVWRLRKHRKRMFMLLRACLFSGVVASLLCSGFLVGFLADAPMTSRIDPTVVKGLDEGVWSPWSWISLLVPTAHALPSDWIQTDVSHVNGFLGWAPLLILAFGWRQLTRQERWVGTCVVAISVVAALGSKGGLHPLLADVVPGFNMFRHTAQFRVYAILVILIGAGIVMDRRLTNKACQTIVMLSLGLAMLAVGLCVLTDHTPEWKDMWHWWHHDPVVRQNDVRPLLGQWCLYLIPWLLVLVGFGRWKSHWGLWQVLSMQMVMMVLGTWAVFGSTVARRESHELLESQFKTLSVAPYGGHQHLIREIGPHEGLQVWRNAPMVLKHPSHQGYNPFQLAWFRDVVKSPLYANMEGHPIMWCSVNGKEAEVTVTKHELNLVEAEVACPCNGKGELVWAQNHHPRWQVEVNGASGESLFWEEGLLATNVQCHGALAGPIKVSWRYRPGMLWHACWLTLGSWLVAAGVSLTNWRTRELD